MSNSLIIDDNGLCHSERDSTWEPEIRREILQGIVDVERRAVLANLICWLVVALAAATLPNAALYIAPLAFRLLAMVGTRATFSRVRRRLSAGLDYQRHLIPLMAALFLGGVSWGATILPVVIEPFLNPGRLLVGGATIAGVSIIVSLLLPVPRLAFAYTAGFFCSFGLGLLWAPSEFALKAALGNVGLFAIFLSYGYATIARHRKAAELLVENRRLSEELATALAHSDFLAYRDSLTGLQNRRAFFKNDREDGGEQQKFVLTIDLDHFKAVNDTFGHPMGDRVLIGVADAIRSVIEKLGTEGHCAARLGGEEFAMILNVSEIEMAELIAQIVRLEIAQVPRRLEEDDLVTTASIGLSVWKPGEALDDVLGRADGALYRAKSRGRDCVVHARIAA